MRGSAIAANSILLYFVWCLATLVYSSLELPWLEFCFLSFLSYAVTAQQHESSSGILEGASTRTDRLDKARRQQKKRSRCGALETETETPSTNPMPQQLWKMDKRERARRMKPRWRSKVRSWRGREGWKRSSSDEVGTQRRLYFTGLSSAFSERNVRRRKPSAMRCAEKSRPHAEGLFVTWSQDLDSEKKKVLGRRSSRDIT